MSWLCCRDVARVRCRCWGCFAVIFLAALLWLLGLWRLKLFAMLTRCGLCCITQWCVLRGASSSRWRVHTPRPLRGLCLPISILATTDVARQPCVWQEFASPVLTHRGEVSSGRWTVEMLVLSPDYPSLRIPLLAWVSSSTRVSSPGRGGMLSTDEDVSERESRSRPRDRSP